MALISISGYAGSGKDTVGKIIQWCTAVDKYPEHTPDSFAKYIKKYNDVPHPILSNGQPTPFIIKKWAGKLKDVAQIISGIPLERFEDQDFKTTSMPQCWSGWAVFVRDYRLDSLNDLQITSVYHTIKEAEEAKDDYLKSIKRKNLTQYIEANVLRVDMSVREFLQKLGTEGLRNGLHPNTWVNALMSEYTKRSRWVITDTRFPNEMEAVTQQKGITIRVRKKNGKPVNKHSSENSLDGYMFDYEIDNSGTIEDLVVSVKYILEEENMIG
jgi:hypothetical protein